MQRRQWDLAEVAARLQCDLIASLWRPEEYRSAVTPLEDPQSVQFYPDLERRARKRCRRCYRQQLDGTAQAAISGDFAAFSTTLLVSPYQDRTEILAVGSEAGQANELPFLVMTDAIGPFWAKKGQNIWISHR